ncbi:hypothetical protein AK88_05312 [Plasmodium fragile]|uniref:Schizont-infected cell agglutination extracellular alpha domain-containing protein n=1 Tax=Plasmodium fragile TaxID=5857 RepID=A0A0D9QDZ7_PLAFR|nr:uncharacterized protein AK88_05312 [Plasmodium fragile]KJP85057.1 hypothetical protein AK88_05312 [Plasmodium fragile]
MSAKEFTDLLVEYILERKIQGDLHDGQDFSEKIWNDIENMFKELVLYVDDRKNNPMLQVMCNYSDFSAEYLKGPLNRFLCMEVGKIFYYMEGLNNNGTAQRSTDPGERELRNYLRCMIGTWTLMSLHGNKCNIREITTHVSTLMRTLAHTFHAVTNRDTCAWVTFEELKIGMRLTGEAMEQWVTQWKSRRSKITQGIRAGGCDKLGGGRMRIGSGQGDAPSNNIDILKSENLDQLHSLIENKEYLPKARVRDIMVKVGNSKNTQQGKKILEDAINTWDQERNKISSNAAETSSTPAAPSGGSEHGNQDASTNTSGQQPQAGRRPPAAPPHPHAAKPASPPGRGLTTPSGTKTSAGDKCDWKSVLDKGRNSTLYVMRGYNENQRTKLKSVLDAFAQHMQKHEQLMEQLGANCDNSGWEDFTPGVYHKDQTVGDMMRCRLMNTALWFANKDDKDDEEVNRLRCEVANVFGYILKNIYCKDKGGYNRGIEYAYTAMRNMGNTVNGTEGLKGPVAEGRCTMCGYVGHTHNVEAVNLEIAQWLMNQGGILAEIQQLQQQRPCAEYWQDYIKKEAAESGPVKDTLKPEAMEEMDKAKKEIKKTATRVFEAAEKKVQDKITELQGKNTNIRPDTYRTNMDGRPPQQHTHMRREQHNPYYNVQAHFLFFLFGTANLYFSPYYCYLCTVIYILISFHIKLNENILEMG